VCVLVDEIMRKSMSRMIDEMKIVSGKSKRYTTSHNLDDDQNLIITNFRSPYMTMPEKWMNRIFWTLFSLIVILALSQF
jgi:hypothetical protein